MIVRNAGRFGILQDLKPWELPPEAWTAGQNVRPVDGAMEKFLGYSTSGLGTPTVAPIHVLPYRDNTVTYWIYAGTNDVYVTDGTTHKKITRQQTTNIATITTGNPTTIDTSSAHNITDGDTVTIAGVAGNTPDINGTHTATVTDSDTFTIPVNTTVAGSGGTVTADYEYSATETENLTSFVFNGIPILNNAVDDPQQWSPVDFATPGLLSDLANWPASTTCKALRGFKQFLVAMNVTKSSVQYPRMVKWSTAAAANAVPTSWDETDATNDAGEIELSDSTGVILDGGTVGEVFAIYKDDSIWGMQFIGAPLIFRFYKVSSHVGALSKRCIADTPLGHIVFATDDVILFNGSSVQSVLDGKSRRALYSSIDAENYRMCYAVTDLQRSEVWCCYPNTGSSRCDRAMVYNYTNGTVGWRDLPNTQDITFGIFDPGATTDDWNSDSASWDSDSQPWNAQLFNASQRKLVGAGTTDTRLQIFNDTYTEDGTNMTSFAERTGIVEGDLTAVKYLDTVYLMMSGGPVQVEIGAQMDTDEPVTWLTPVTFDPITDSKIDARISGRLFAIRIKSTADVEWRLYGYNMPMIPVAQR